MENLPIIDLHCDLLSFLAENPSHTIYDDKSNASYPQMQQGGVAVQVLAIFTPNTSNSFIEANKQINLLDTILHSGKFSLFSKSNRNPSSVIQVFPAFENALGFCSDSMTLEQGFAYLESVLARFSRILYISLTWDGENRFGGGNGSRIGLKEDGKILLQWMSGKKIALDFSHTSDFLADDLLNYIDKKSLDVPVLASHSNLRSITNKERNLPDFLAQEIITRKGLIGLNFFAPFLGENPMSITKHVQSLLSLGAENSLCFGADFFPNLLADYVRSKYQTDLCFFPEIGNSSSYPKALSLLQSHLHLSQEMLKKIAFDNAFQFITTS